MSGERSPGGPPEDDDRPPSWQGAPGYSGIDPDAFGPYTSRPGEPGYPGIDPDGLGPYTSTPGEPGYPGIDPDAFGPHAPLPGAPPYPPGTEPERAAVADRDPAPPPIGSVLPRCVAAGAGWAAVALLLALFTGVASWPLRGLALLVPWGLTAAALFLPARRGAGPGGLVALAFGPFWLLHALLVGLLGW